MEKNLRIGYNTMSNTVTDGTFTGSLIPAGSTQLITGSYILSDVSNSVGTNANFLGTGSRQIVAPFISTMYAGASGEVGVLQQSTVSIVDIDAIFTVDMNDAYAVKALRGFSVRDVDVSGAGEANVDPSAHIIVTMRGGETEKNEFNEALRYALTNATAVTDSAPLATYLKEEAQTDVERLLNYDGLANLLEASVLKTFAIELDVSHGANNMWTTMDNGAAAQRRALFTQIDEARVEKYATVSEEGVYINRERVALMNFLPLTVGDNLALVWDVVVGDYAAGSNTAPAAGAAISRATGDFAPAPTGPAAASGTESYIIGAHTAGKYEDGSIVISKPTLRRIAVRLNFGKTGATRGDAYEVAVSGAPEAGYVLNLA
jgi:hypothetical protein